MFCDPCSRLVLILTVAPEFLPRTEWRSSCFSCLSGKGAVRANETTLVNFWGSSVRVTRHQSYTNTGFASALTSLPMN